MRRRVQVASARMEPSEDAVRPSAPVPRTQAAAVAVAVVPPPPAPTGGGRRGSRGKALPSLDVALAEAETRGASNDWTGAQPTVLVGLYAAFHKRVYGVVPEELRQEREFKAAVRTATTMLVRDFHEDPVAMSEFIGWTWTRERQRAEWAARERKDRNRMVWRWQFGPGYLTDYRAHLHQQKGRQQT